MADLSLEDQLKFRRKRVMTETSLGPQDSRFELYEPESDVSDINLPPPPPPMPQTSAQPSVENGRKHQKFDLRPESMKVGRDKLNRPPVASVGVGIKNPVSDLITPQDLISARVNLRKSLAGKVDTSYGSASFQSSSKHDEELQDRSQSPVIEESEITKSSGKLGSLKVTLEASDLRRERISQIRKRRDSAIHFPPRPEHGEEPKVTTERPASEEKQENSEAEVTMKNSAFDELKLRSESSLSETVREWMNSAEAQSNRASERPHKEVAPSSKQRFSKSIASSRDEDETSFDDTRSVRTARSALSTMKKKFRSPSVCFSFPEGNDNISEVSDDDIINTDARHQDYGSYEYVCERLRIREPFTQPELNVLHAICGEYFEIASLTFAKKKFFIRSLPHNERVYNYLASRKKSGWLEKSDIARGAISSRTLDFLFSVTLRRRSRKIEGHTLDLNGFKEGKVLDIQRFTRIIKDAHIRRDHLFECAVGRLHDYSKMK